MAFMAALADSITPIPGAHSQDAFRVRPLSPLLGKMLRNFFLRLPKPSWLLICNFIISKAADEYPPQPGVEAHQVANSSKSTVPLASVSSSFRASAVASSVSVPPSSLIMSDTSLRSKAPLLSASNFSNTAFNLFRSAGDSGLVVRAGAASPLLSLAQGEKIYRINGNGLQLSNWKLICFHDAGLEDA